MRLKCILDSKVASKNDLFYGRSATPPCKGSRQFPEEERQETKRAAHRARQSQASNEDGLGIDEKSRHRVECVLARQPRVLST
jgi:hypothetical protein